MTGGVNQRLRFEPRANPVNQKWAVSGKLGIEDQQKTLSAGS
jgi:hypothetical protein